MCPFCLVWNYDEIHINQFPVLFKESFSANPHSFVQDRLTFANSKRNIFWPIMKMLFPETNFCCMFQTDHHFVGIVDRPEKKLRTEVASIFFDQANKFLWSTLESANFPSYSIFNFHFFKCILSYKLCLVHLWEASCHVFVICLNASFLIRALSYASYFYIYMRFVLCSLMRSLVAPVHLTKPLFPLHGLRAQRKTQERTGTVHLL